MLLADFIRRGTKALGALYPEAEARSMTLLLCEERLGVKSYTHIIDPSYAFDEGLLRQDMERLLAGEPLQYVLGKAEFCGRSFKVDAKALIPRPETEILVREASAVLSGLPGPARILDLCTGSGCIAWTLALDHPDASVLAVDVSRDALDLAGSQFPGSVAKPEFLEADILQPLPVPDGALFDLLVSNPPYITDGQKAEMRRNVLDYEPGLALFVPDDDPLRFYRAIAVQASRLLAPGGSGMVEINDAYGPETAGVFVRAGFKQVRIVNDLADRQRVVIFEKDKRL